MRTTYIPGSYILPLNFVQHALAILHLIMSNKTDSESSFSAHAERECDAPSENQMSERDGSQKTAESLQWEENGGNEGE